MENKKRGESITVNAQEMQTLILMFWIYCALHM